MKAYLLISFITVFFHHTNAQQLSGDFPEFANADFRIVGNISAINQYRGDSVVSGKTNSKGQFHCNYSYEKEGMLTLYIGNIFLKFWSAPNNQLQIDYQSHKDIVFKGKGARENCFVFESGFMQPGKLSPVLFTDKFRPKEHNHFMDSLESKRNKLLNTLVRIGKVSSKFTEYFRAEIKYFTIYRKSQYIKLVGLNTQRSFDPSLEYFSFWKNFTIQRDSLESESYLNATQDYVQFIVEKQFPELAGNREKIFDKEFTVLDSLLKEKPYTRQRLTGEKLLVLIKYFDVPNVVEERLYLLATHFPESRYNLLLQNEWSLKNGRLKKKPLFVLKDKDGNSFDITSLRGKIVYVDFWGSWCKPCMLQMPNSKLLQDKFKGKNVAFLFVNFFDSKDKWLQTINVHGLTGIHIKAEKSDEEYFNTFFGVKDGFPRYALMDKDGMLVTTSAPHPDDKSVTEFLNSFLH